MAQRRVTYWSTTVPILATAIVAFIWQRARGSGPRRTLSGRRLAAVLDQAPLSIHLFAPDGRSLLMNRRWEALWQGTTNDIRERNILDSPEIEATGLVPYLRAGMAGQTLTTPPLLFDPARTGEGGEPRWLRGYIAPITDESGTVREVVLIEEDVTAQRDYEQQLYHRALHDPLTGLPNRVLLLDRLQQSIARATRDGNVALLLLDLDRFKGINDSLGHPAGDQLLIEVAQLLTAAVRPGDTVARLGGDEFAILADDLLNTTGAASLALRLLDTLGRAMNVQGQEITPQASIGIAFGGADTTTDELLQHADMAMYAAKRAGRGRYALFDSALLDGARERLTIEAELRRAIAQGELALYYQPVEALATGRLVAVEALVRWHHPTRGTLGPHVFISLAEETGLIHSLGRWVVREACRQLQAWRDRFGAAAPPTVNVNLSARQFGDAQLVAEIEHALRETGLPPSSLALELTESAVMGDPAAASVTLEALRDLGVRLALDDFGTGYSSLEYLRRFPIDTLKIDRAFVGGIEDDARGASLVEAIIGLGQALELTVVAEGIETTAVLAQLRAFGCDAGQGHYFAGPLPPEALESLLGESTLTEARDARP